MNYCRFDKYISLKYNIMVLLMICVFSVQAQHSQKYTEKYPNGHIKVKGKKKDGAKAGLWLFYDINGNIYHKEKWKKGKLSWSIEYNEKHQKVMGVNEKGEVIYYKGCNCKN